ncbi:hypothetical protein OMW55_08115 [Sphingomonas sp. BN140010]|uniref:Uncharacterized protein n=1 Tax=Sphingomonas arvum TaxID=2992113 RepID=A0ABT3JFB8_9SPHN|nr:hypothetical protein [Sphingomonas sp. BN140010]MCW3797766.1 hypothetical protein [Sphingomonas sp. BN140010]
MTSAPHRRLGPASWLLLIVVLLLAGAAAAVWGLKRWNEVARFVGLGAAPAVTGAPGGAPQLALAQPAVELPAPTAAATVDTARDAVLEARVARLENATQQVAGSAGRADALLVSFAARRAVDRGVPLGYLEPLLAQRFGGSNRQAVATVITGARAPVRLDQLTVEFDALGPQLRGGGPNVGFWEATRRELGSLVAIRRADRPSPRPSATYDRARARLQAGQVDQALAEAMRLPGIGATGPWVDRARRYVAVHRALDELESAALLAR